MSLTNEETKFKSICNKASSDIFVCINKDMDTYWSSDNAPSIRKYGFIQPIELIKELEQYIDTDTAKVIAVAAFKSRANSVDITHPREDEAETALPEYVYNF